MATRMMERLRLSASRNGATAGARGSSELLSPWVLLALFVFTFFYAAAFVLIGRFFLVPFVTPLIILALLVIWALPETGRPPTRILSALFLGFAISLLAWPDYLALALPGLPWITAARIFGFPMVMVMLIAFSVSNDFTRRVVDTSRAVKPTVVMLLLFAGLMILSVGFSTFPAFSANKLLVALVNWIALFFVALYFFSREGKARLFAYVLWAATVFWILMGIWEWRISALPWASSIPSFLRVEDEAVQRILSGTARSATGMYRVQGKFTTSLGLAEFLALTTPFIIYFVLNARNLAMRVLASITLAGTLFTIINTDSRLGAVGFFASILLMAFFWAVDRWRSDRLSILGPAIALSYPVLFAGFFALTFVSGRLENMVWGDGQHQASNESRFEQWDMGFADILSRPWGYGIGRGAETLGFTSPTGILTIDSYYLSVLLEFGIIGFLLFYGMFLYAGWKGSRTIFEKPRTGEVRLLVPTIIALFNFVLIKSVFSQQENHPIAFILLALCVALVWRAKSADRALEAGRSDGAIASGQ